jgi:hypothetical protein
MKTGRGDLIYQFELHLFTHGIMILAYPVFGIDFDG